MARKRMIDPSFWSDEKLGECTIQERLLFMGLISNADDEGYGRANPKLLKSLIFPYDDLRASDLEKWLSHLGGLNLVCVYEYNGQTYYNLPNFHKHQTINRPTETTFPKLNSERCSSTTVILTEHSLSTHGVLTEHSVLIEEKRKEEKKKRKEIEEKRKEYNTITTQKFQKPTLEDVIEYCNERNNGINAEHFIDFYESKGWKVGNQPMKDWKASIRTWEKNNYDNNTNKSSGNPFFDILKKEGKL